jgi:hypothetical protein
MTGEAQVLFILCVSIGGVVAYTRYLRHVRDMTMIEHGMDPRQPEPGTGNSGRRLDSVLVTIGVGLALTIGMAFIGFGPWLLAGLIPLFIGLARLLSLLIQRDVTAKQEEQEASHGS